MPKDIAAALADVQAAHDAAHASQHAHALAAMDAMPSAQQRDMALNNQPSALRLKKADSTSAAVAEAELEVDSIDDKCESVAEAVLEVDGTDNTSGAVAEAAMGMNSTDDIASAASAVQLCSSNIMPTAVAETDPVMQHTAGAAVTAQYAPPQQSDSITPPSSQRPETECGLNGNQSCADVAHGATPDESSSPDTQQEYFPGDLTRLAQPHGTQDADRLNSMQKHSAASTANMTQGDTAVKTCLQAADHNHSSTGASQAESKGALLERSSESEAAKDKLLGLQLQRIRDSAVMLPEPAEVLVTDLLDHRLVALLCCAVLSCAVLCCLMLCSALLCSVPSLNSASVYVALFSKSYKCMTCIARLALFQHSSTSNRLDQTPVRLACLHCLCLLRCVVATCISPCCS